MKFKNIFLLSWVVFLFASCSSTYRVASDYERHVNFSSFKTFQILKQKNGFPKGANPINKQRIDRAILKEMNLIGFDTGEQPDLLVAWFIKVRNVRDVDVYHDYYGRWRRTDWVQVREYQEGTLVVDIIDRKNKQVVWHGKTTDRNFDTMENPQEEIYEAVHAIFKKFAKDTRLDKTYASN